MSDFKELIPEFYDIEQCCNFLTNKYDINFGYRHDGRKVRDVDLPPWSKSELKLYSSVCYFIYFFCLFLKCLTFYH